MALREIEPLDDEEWATLVADLEKGQTPEQEAALAKALESVDEIPTVVF